MFETSVKCDRSETEIFDLLQPPPIDIVSQPATTVPHPVKYKGIRPLNALYYAPQRGLTREVQHLKVQAMRICQTFHSAPQPNSALHADAKTGHAFGIFMASVGALHSLRSFRRRLPWALGHTNIAMQSVQKVILSAFFAMCLSVNAAEPTFDLGPPKEQIAVAEQAQKVIFLLDSGEIGRTWENGAPPLKDSTSKLVYVAGINAMRGAVGNVVSRKLQAIGFMRNMPNAPPGEYAAAFLETTFSRASSVEEKLVFYKFQGKWQLAGYFLKKRFTSNMNGSKQANQSSE